VLSSEEYSGQSVDIWAYGIVMYAMGEGKHPFVANNYNELERVVKKGVYQYKKIVGCIHQAFIKKILKINPEERPGAQELINHPWLNIEN
jgi:serine/threonine protein kinase